MARVRPGVDETLAAFSPTSAFSRLDLPTFERPRNAISGASGEGNCAAESAEAKIEPSIAFGAQCLLSLVYVAHYAEFVRVDTA